MPNDPSLGGGRATPGIDHGRFAPGSGRPRERDAPSSPGVLLLLSWWCCRAAEMTSGPKFEWIRIALLPMCRKGQMGQKMVRFAALSGTRSRQDEPIEVGEVGSKRPSLGGNGGHFAWWRSAGAFVAPRQHRRLRSSAASLNDNT